MNPDCIRIRVVIDDLRAPAGSLPQQVWLEVSRAEFHDAFSPLPRDRELSFLPEAQRRAVEQQVARQRAAEIIALKIVPAIVEAMGKIDSNHGYSPQEWERMHRE